MKTCQSRAPQIATITTVGALAGLTAAKLGGVTRYWQLLPAGGGVAGLALGILTSAPAKAPAPPLESPRDENPGVSNLRLDELKVPRYLRGQRLDADGRLTTDRENTLDLSMDHLAASFLRMGGTIDPVRTIDLSDTEQVDGLFVQIPTGAVVYPVCNEGANRSQLTYHALNDQAIDLQLPHGVGSGIDIPAHIPEILADRIARQPQAALDSLTAFPVYGTLEPIPIHTPDGSFSLERVPRFLEEASVDRLEKTHFVSADYRQVFPEAVASRQEQRMAFSEAYFEPILQHALKGRQVVILAYAQAAHVMLMRLVEQAMLRNNNVDLTTVRIVPINSDDPVTSANDQAIPNFNSWLKRNLVVESE